jgi:hypothetical protein
MTIEEEEEFIYQLLEFFFLNAPEYVKVDDAELWYQQSVDWVEDNRKNRHLKGLGPNDLVSREVTLILEAAFYGNYTSSEIDSAIVTLIRDNKEDLVINLRGSDLSYFMQIDAIQAKAVEKITLAPVASPESLAEVQSADSQEGGSSSNAGGVFNADSCLVLTPLYWHLHLYPSQSIV